MVHNYYGIYDSVAKCYAWVGESKNDQTFARMCNVMEKDNTTFIGQSPQDYTGYKLAEFEDENGCFVMGDGQHKVWEGKPHE